MARKCQSLRWVSVMDRVEYDNLKFLNIEETNEDLSEIDETLSRIGIQGGRLNEGLCVPVEQ